MIAVALIAIGTALAWIGAVAVFRLRTPLDRVHAVTFLNVACGAAILLAAFATDGVSARTLKIVAIWLLMILSGALLSFRVARALRIREGQRL